VSLTCIECSTRLRMRLRPIRYIPSDHEHSDLKISFFYLLFSFITDLASILIETRANLCGGIESVKISLPRTSYQIDGHLLFVPYRLIASYFDRLVTCCLMYL
jgi:hypothetical protein